MPDSKHKKPPFINRSGFDTFFIGSRNRSTPALLKKESQSRRPSLEELDTAYRSAVYEYIAPDKTLQEFRVDQRSDSLVKLLSVQGVNQAAFISACNPNGIANPRHENLGRLFRLSFRIRDHDCAFLSGRGRDDSGHWPDEPSLMALGIDKSDAFKLAREFNQIAFIWVEKDGVPRLVYTEPSA
jgi:hypothetical protein